jgi:ABC-type uncharacterized transport system YnjBCD ATPase subunit
VLGLRKAYGTVEAVAGIGFEVAEGECFALLGPNGAGKTTTRSAASGPSASGHPVPAWVYVAARILSSVWFSVVSAVLVVAVGVALFHLQVVWRMLPAAVVTLLLGASCFCRRRGGGRAPLPVGATHGRALPRPPPRRHPLTAAHRGRC